MSVTDQELDHIFQNAVAAGEETIAAKHTAPALPTPDETEELEQRVQSTVALLDEAAVALPPEQSNQILDLRAAITGPSEEVTDPLHVARGVIYGGLWGVSLWLVIVAVLLWILVFAGMHF